MGFGRYHLATRQGRGPVINPRDQLLIRRRHRRPLEPALLTARQTWCVTRLLPQIPIGIAPKHLKSATVLRHGQPGKDMPDLHDSETKPIACLEVVWGSSRRRMDAGEAAIARRKMWDKERSHMKFMRSQAHEKQAPCPVPAVTRVLSVCSRGDDHIQRLLCPSSVRLA